MSREPDITEHVENVLAGYAAGNPPPIDPDVAAQFAEYLLKTGHAEIPALEGNSVTMVHVPPSRRAGALRRIRTYRARLRTRRHLVPRWRARTGLRVRRTRHRRASRATRAGPDAGDPDGDHDLLAGTTASRFAGRRFFVPERRSAGHIARRQIHLPTHTAVPAAGEGPYVQRFDNHRTNGHSLISSGTLGVSALSACSRWQPRCSAGGSSGGWRSKSRGLTRVSGSRGSDVGFERGPAQAARNRPP